jgi:uncharacterized membrane protein YkoI
MNRWSVTALLVCTLSFYNITGADDHREARRLMQAGKILPLQTVVESLRGQQAGRILEVELEREAGQYIYEIELLDRFGQVRELHIDAVSGVLLSSESED